jgi:hypothetical protein
LELIDQWLYPRFPLPTATEVSPELFLVLNIISSSSFIKSVKSLITSPQKDNLCCCLSKKQLQDKWHGISCHVIISVEQ